MAPAIRSLGWAGGRGDAAMVTTAGGSSVADVAYMHSDVAFLFPIVPEAAFGAELLNLAGSDKTNLRGGPCRSTTCRRTRTPST